MSGALFLRKSFPLFRKLSSRYNISVKNRPILMEYGTLQQILNQVIIAWPKFEIFKIQDGGGRHLENRFFGHNSSTGCPILAKLCTGKQNGMLTKATWQKLQIFKIQDGGRPPFWKSLSRHISVKIVRLWWSLVHYSRYWTQWHSRYQKLNFLNSRWRQPPS